MCCQDSNRDTFKKLKIKIVEIKFIKIVINDIFAKIENFNRLLKSQIENKKNIDAKNEIDDDVVIEKKNNFDDNFDLISIKKSISIKKFH